MNKKETAIAALQSLESDIAKTVAIMRRLGGLYSKESANLSKVWVEVRELTLRISELEDTRAKPAETPTCGSQALDVVGESSEFIVAVCHICGKKVCIDKKLYSEKQLKDWLGR